MNISIDLGGSTVDILLFREKNILRKISLEAKTVIKSDLGTIFSRAKISEKNIRNIIVTGGRNRVIPSIYKTIKVWKISEIQAIAYGGSFLANVKNALIISMGTGTCMVSYRNGKFRHAGGTALGGGTLVGLGKLILKEDNAVKLEILAKKGDLSKVDLSVKDIVGGGIGIIPGFATASNFGKLARPGKEDLALGICNMIGQTIGALANFLAKSLRHEHIVLTGKLTRVRTVVRLVKKTAKIYQRKILLPKNADFVCAIGAMRAYQEKTEK